MAGGDLTGALSVCESFAKVLLGPSKGYFFGNVTVKVLPLGSHVNVSPGQRETSLGVVPSPGTIPTVWSPHTKLSAFRPPNGCRAQAARNKGQVETKRRMLPCRT